MSSKIGTDYGHDLVVEADGDEVVVEVSRSEVVSGYSVHLTVPQVRAVARRFSEVGVPDALAGEGSATEPGSSIRDAVATVGGPDVRVQVSSSAEEFKVWLFQNAEGADQVGTLRFTREAAATLRANLLATVAGEEGDADAAA